MAAVATPAEQWDRDGAKVLRIAFATSLAMVLAIWLNLQLPYIASVLVLALMPAMQVRPPVKLLVLLVVAVMLFTTGFVAVLTPLLTNTAMYLAGLGFLLFLLFRLQSHPKFAPLGALALPLLVLLSPLIPVSDTFAGGLALLLGALALIAMAATMLAWLVFPDPVAATAAPPVMPPQRSWIDAAISAVILLALIGATLALDAQTAMRLLMICSSVLAVADPGASRSRAGMTVAATVAGVLAAWVLTGMMALMASLTMATLLATLVPLLIGRRLVQPETGMFWVTALTAMWVLIGLDGSATVAKLVNFTLLTVAGVAIALGARHTLLWHFDRSTRTPAT